MKPTRLVALGSTCMVAAGALGSGAAIAELTTLTLNPKATYFRTNSDNGALQAVPIELGPLGIAPGDILRLTRLGDYRPRPGVADASRTQVGVFSSSTTLLAANVEHRVPGAIAAGEPFVTANTFFGGLSTDIPEDFLIGSGTQDSVMLIVPNGAAYLFVSPNDSLFFDNDDPDGDWGVGLAVHPLGDMNGDCSLDAFDVAPFELALADKAAYLAAFPGLNPDILGDIDHSGQLDAFDVADFERALAGGSAVAVPEPGGLVLLILAASAAFHRPRRHRT